MPKPKNVVDTFLSSSLPTSGSGVSRAGCCTCKLPNIKEINEACHFFYQKKQEGETTHSWRDFHGFCLRPSFNYPYGKDAMRNHVKDCLGL